MNKLSDDLLIEAYQTAKDLSLEKAFILLLEQEIRRRKLPIKTNYVS